MGTPKVLISVLNWNNFNSTSRTLDSIKNLSYVNYELIIIDNNSTDYSIEKIQEYYPEYQILKNKSNLGYAGGHKQSLDYLCKNKFELLWIINNDIIVIDSTLSELVKSYNKNGQGLYGSLILNRDHIIQFSGGNELTSNFIDFYKSNIFFGKKYDDVKSQLEEKKVGILHGASFLIPVDIIKKYGFIKTSFFLYGEEVDYCLRLLKKGINSFIAPRSVVYHYEGDTVNMNDKLFLIGIYYKKRNSLYYNNNYNFPGCKRIEIIKRYGGIHKLCFIILKSFFYKYLIKSPDKQNQVNFYELIALLHFLIGVKGKVYSPEKYL